MILGFMDCMIKPLQDRTKIHTCRKIGNRNYKIGMSIQYYAKVRTKKQYKIREDEIIRGLQILRFLKNENGIFSVQILDSPKRNISDIEQFSFNDGFQNIIECENFFVKNKELPFMSEPYILIHWTDFKY